MLTGTATALRVTYGMDPAFTAARDEYEEACSSGRHGLSEHDRTQNWLKGLTGNQAKQASDPKLVDQKVHQLQQLMLQHGLQMPFTRSGPCQYKLGVHKLRLKVAGNKLLARCGGGYENLLSAVDKMTVCSIA